MSIHENAEAIASKIKYELNMLHYCFNRILDEEHDVDWGMHNMHLECFLLHARVLRDFFVKDPEQNDVSAIHFFEDSTTWEKNAANLCPYTNHQQHRIRLNRYLAHLSYDRLKEEKDWDCKIIYKELVYAWKQFISLLPEKCQPWFKNSIT